MNRRRTNVSLNLLIAVFIFVCISNITAQGGRCNVHYVRAICHMRTNPNKPENDIRGTVYLRQRIWRNCKPGFLSVQVKIDGVPLTPDNYEHGLHVHQFGNLSGGCESMGPHYNPFNAPHGGPWDPHTKRHVGDFGNINQSPVTGRINRRHVDYWAKLQGPYSIVGRGLVLHADRDDLGRGGDAGSAATGNAGARLACCVIEYSDEQAPLGSYTLY